MQYSMHFLFLCVAPRHSLFEIPNNDETNIEPLSHCGAEEEPINFVKAEEEAHNGGIYNSAPEQKGHKLQGKSFPICSLSQRGY